jgi:hypothetical protein
MPTGNPRQKGIAQAAKIIAQKWGQDTGNPVSDTTYQGKRTFINQANSSLPNSFGGQRNAGNTALEHQEELANKIKDLGNTNLGGYFPTMAHWINKMRQEGTAEQKAKANALDDAVERYVDEVKKFYSGSSTGGEAERMAARERFNSAKTPEELYAALRTERNLMMGKMHQLEASADQALGRHRERQIGPIIRQSAQEAMGRVDKIMDDYARGTAGPAAAAKEKYPNAPGAHPTLNAAERRRRAIEELRRRGQKVPGE